MLTWMIDPFSGNHSASLRTSAKSFSALGRAARIPVEPLYVCSPAEMKIAYASGSLEREKMRRYALEKCQAALPKPSADLKAPRVLFEKSLSLSASAVTAAAYARRSRTEFICVSTRSRGGTGLRGLGSFTNALMAAATVPVVSVRPEVTLTAPRRILFATDFSPASTRALKRLLPIAKRFGVHLIIAHVFMEPSVPMMADPFMLTTPYPVIWTPKDFRQAIAEQMKSGRKFARTAEAHGVSAEVIVQRSKYGITAGVLRAARRHRADWIALAGESGRFGRYVLGTTAQALVHASPLPVWTYKAV